jgi:hypothetical protein
MPNFDGTPPTHRRTCKLAIGAFMALALACLALTACGGSSGTSTNAAATAATSASATSPAGGSAAPTAARSSTRSAAPGTPNATSNAGPRRFPAIRECLQKSGVTLPKHTPGSGGPPVGGAFPGANGRPALPKGVTRAQFEAALKKCGGRGFGGGVSRPGGTGPRTVNPGFRQGLAKFATCLKQNGVDVPNPNTSGKGPIFSTKGIDTKSAKFRAATVKCHSILIGAFRRPPGAAPPAAGQAQGGSGSG